MPIDGNLDLRLCLPDYGRLLEILPHACQNPGGVLQAYALSRIVLQRKIPGDFVECGVAAGAQLAVMATAMRREGDQRVIHAFDSFEGIPHAGPMDDQQPGLPLFQMDRDLPLRERLVTTHVSGCPLECCQQLWEKWKYTESRVEWHAGWFQDTLPKTQLGAIAFLRLDGDLYESTECCLAYLYDNVSPGGLVFIDDYGLGGCKRAVHDFLDSRKLDPALLQDQEGNAGAVYWFKT